MENMDISIIKFYLIIFISVISTPVLVVSIYYGLGYSTLMRFVDPSFELRLKRLLELIVVFYIFSCLSVFYIDVISTHFHIPNKIIKNSLYLTFIPSILYTILRCIVRFHSSRIARDHLNIIIFIVLVSSSVSLTYSFVDNDIYHLRFDVFTLQFLIATFILSIIIPITCEVILLYAVKWNICSEYIVKHTRLIDLSEELPAKIEFIIGEKDIEKKIKQLITDNIKNELRIITNKYTTIEKYLDEILGRCDGGGVSILGSQETDELKEKFYKFNERGLLYCPSSYDNIRLLIDGEKRLLLSFATSGNKGSHVGIYSEHPFIVSLFINYFDTKCRSIGCKNRDCKNKNC